MNIKELSKITGVNPETIRMYRNKGFLNPKAKENGYYDYQMKELIELTYLRKLRSYRYSFDKINEVYQASSPSEIMEILDEQELFLNEQIQDMNIQLQFIQREKKHLAHAIRSVDGGAFFTDYNVNRIDLFDTEDLKHFQNYFSRFTPTIRISKDILNGEIEDRYIPLDVGLGTVPETFAETGQAIPDNAHIISDSEMIVQALEVHDFSKINLLDLAPMMTYAKKHHMIFTDDTTAAMITVRKVDHDIVGWFTIRARAEERK